MAHYEERRVIYMITLLVILLIIALVVLFSIVGGVIAILPFAIEVLGVIGICVLIGKGIQSIFSKKN